MAPRKHDPRDESLEEVLLGYASHHMWEKVRWIVNKGADVTYTNEHGQSALHFTQWGDDVPIDVMYMLSHPILSNSSCRLGLMTPAHIAAPFDLYMRLADRYFNIDMLVLLKRICARYLGVDLQEQELTDLKSVLKFFLMHVEIHYPKKISVQQEFSKTGKLVASKACIVSKNGEGPNPWSTERVTKKTTSEWRWVVLCMIKCGYTVKFLPPIHQCTNAQNQQQEDQAMKEIKEIYPEYKHQEENEVPKLSDLCSNVIHAHMQKPVTAEKFKQLPVPKEIVRLLTREDMADQVYDAMVESPESSESSDN